MRYTQLKADAKRLLPRGLSKADAQQLDAEAARPDGTLSKNGVRQLRQLKKDFKQDLTEPGRKELDRAIATKVAFRVRPLTVSSYG